MFAKIVVLILCVGGCACVLLATRQARILAAHDLADARLRVMQRDNELWRLKAEIAARITPEHVRRIAGKITPLKPVGPDALTALNPAGSSRVVRFPPEADGIGGRGP